MSYDVKLQNYCDHKILWAQAQLEADMKTVYLPYPLASASSLKVRVNGVTVSPALYSIKTLRKSLSLTVISIIEFFNKVKHSTPIIEFNYVALSETCPKCLNVKSLDDLFINGHGDIEMTSRELLLLQQVEKVIVTKLSSNAFHDWYGTELHSLIGTKISDKNLLYTRVREQVSTAIDKLKNIQKQMTTSGRKFDPGELFGKLLSIDIQDTEDPSMIFVVVSFTSQSNVNMEYTQYLSMNDTLRQRLVL